MTGTAVPVLRASALSGLGVRRIVSLIRERKVFGWCLGTAKDHEWVVSASALPALKELAERERAARRAAEAPKTEEAQRA